MCHNVPFDIGFLLHHTKEQGIKTPVYETFCTLSKVRKLIPERDKSKKLEDLKIMLGMEEYGSHDALEDCYVTKGLYDYIYESYDKGIKPEIYEDKGVVKESKPIKQRKPINIPKGEAPPTDMRNGTVAEVSAVVDRVLSAVGRN